MDDLFKNIKDNLENRPEPPFDERAWQNMENRLDKKPWKGTGLVGWVLPIVLGGLLLSNIFFYKKLNDSNSKLSSLELRADTIFNTRYIYQYDTVYSNKVETEYIVINKQSRPSYYNLQASYFNYPTNYSANTIRANSNPNALTFAELKYLFDDNQEGEKPNMEENELVNGSRMLLASPYLDSPFSPINYNSEPVKLAYLDYNLDQKKRKRPMQKLATNIQPTGFQVGVLAGFAFPQHDQLAESKGYSVGIYGAFSFSDNIRMWGEASYYNVEFKSNEMGKSLGIPEIEDPDDNYEFHEASVHQPFLQYALGMQYIFIPKNKWKPYFGVGYTFASMLPYEVSYDFQHLTDDLELSIEENIDRNETVMNMALFNAGIEGELSDRIGLKLEGYFRWAGNKEGLIITDVYGLRTLLFYKF